MLEAINLLTKKVILNKMCGIVGFLSFQSSKDKLCNREKLLNALLIEHRGQISYLVL